MPPNMLDAANCMTPETFENAATKHVEAQSERLRSDIRSDMLERSELAHA